MVSLKVFVLSGGAKSVMVALIIRLSRLGLSSITYATVVL